MPPKSKGCIQAYDSVCAEFQSDWSFFEWILDWNDNCDFQIGQICWAAVWYEKKSRWYFIENFYNATDEKESTWKARKYTGNKSLEKKPGSFVQKYFDLELNENLLATHNKIRPVILLKKITSDWLNPNNEKQFVESWLCLPLFSYKNRHNQNYVLKDQKLLSINNFYIPPAYSNMPGIKEESAALFNTIQQINVTYLEPEKTLCDIKKMNRPFKISAFGMKIIMFHYMKSYNFFDLILDSKAKKTKDQYEMFKELIPLFINESIS
ncbi:MAG: hypothetical protein GY754_20690 [bacterium]|nr:hypothetical protein [bacterium]